jgi:hypothetical protein
MGRLKALNDAEMRRGSTVVARQRPLPKPKSSAGRETLQTDRSTQSYRSSNALFGNLDNTQFLSLADIPFADGHRREEIYSQCVCARDRFA